MKPHQRLFADDTPVAGVHGEIFGASAPGSRSLQLNRLRTHSVASSSHASSLGSNLHELSDRQINKLVSVKFGGNINLLVRQLSNDITSKELELILLRKEKFVREQELYKIVNEYCNLSSLEIDQRLNGLSKDQNVDKVLSGMIGLAIREDLSRPYSVPERPYSGPLRLVSDSSSVAVARAPKVSPEVISPEPQDDRQVRENRSSGWLSNWFASHEDLYSRNSRSTSSLPAKTDKPTVSRPSRASSFIRNSLANLGNLSHPEDSPGSKVPVELDAFNGYEAERDSTPSTEREIPVAGDINTDKYGFFNDVEHLLLKKDGSKEENGTLSILNDDTLNRNGTLKRRGTVSLSETLSPKLESDGLNSGLVDVRGITTTGTPVSSIDERPSSSIDRLKEIGKLHDEKSLQLDKQWDYFYKELLRDYYKYSNKRGHGPDDGAASMFGLRGLNLVKLDKSISSFLPQTSLNEKEDDDHQENDHRYFKRLRTLVKQSGIAPKYRNGLWYELLGAKNVKIAGEYQQLLDISKTTKDKLILSNINQINLDLHRTLPSNIFFNNLISSQPGPNFYKLQRILYAFVVYKPEVGYCQGMNKIVGNLLLADNPSDDTKGRMTEEDLFWVFVAVIDHVLPHYGNTQLNYFSSESLNHIRTDQQIVFEKYFPRFMPKLHKHLTALKVQVEFITLNWWLSLFTENFLSLEIWFKVFDNLLVNSSTIDTQLIGLSLSTFQIFETVLLGVHSCDDVYLIMNNLNRNNATKMNLKFSDLMRANSHIQKRIDVEELDAFRKTYQKREI